MARSEGNEAIWGAIKSIPWDSDREAVYLLTLDGKISAHKIASGYASHAPVSVSKILNAAKIDGAHEIVLVHNHPSGSVTASSDDVNTTSRLRQVAASHGLNLRDHFIVAGSHIVSIGNSSRVAEAPVAVMDCPLCLSVAQISAAERRRREEVRRQLQRALWDESGAPVLPSGAPVLPAPPESAPQPPWMSINLFEFQKAGVAWLLDKPKAMLIDEMGLGKTFQGIAWASAPGKGRMPCLVVVPASIKYNWEREINRARPSDTVRVLASGGDWPRKLPDWTVINYDIVGRFARDIERASFRSIMLDEAHYIKNSDAQRTQQVLKLSEAIPNRLYITGTPMLNRPIELFTALVFIGALERSAFRRFQDTYTEREIVQGRTVYTGAKNQEQLHEFLKPWALRRQKIDVLKDLPPKLQTQLVVALSNSREYATAEREFLRWLRNKKGDEAAFRAMRAEVIVKLNNLRQLAAEGKVAAIADWLRPCEITGHKVIVFSSFVAPLEKLDDAKTPASILYTGDLNPAERQQAVDGFQKGRKCFFLGTVGAAGVGITLTAADRVMFMDLPWSPGVKQQAEDRAHRIGQKQSVEIINVLARRTIDGKMAEILASKAVDIKRVIEGKSESEAESLSAEKQILDEYLRLADSGVAPEPPDQYEGSDAEDRGGGDVEEVRYLHQARVSQAGDCTEMRLPLESIEIHPEKYQYRSGGSEQAGLDMGHVEDIWENFDPNRFDPIVVRRTETGRYELLSGHHRLAAFKMAGERGGFPKARNYDYSTVPSLIRTVDEETARQLSRLSNASIKEYKPSELARVFKVESDAGLTPDQIGKMYGSRRPGEVQKYLDIALLPREMQEFLDTPEVRKSFTIEHAAVLGKAMREYGLSSGTVRNIFDRVLLEREYTAGQLEKLMQTFGPQLREVQIELFPGQEFTGGLTGILGLVRQAMDGIKGLARKRRLASCVRRMIQEKEAAGESVSKELRRAEDEAEEEINQLDDQIEGIRDKLGLSIRRQQEIRKGPPLDEEEAPAPFVPSKEQIGMIADPGGTLGSLKAVAEALGLRQGNLTALQHQCFDEVPECDWWEEVDQAQSTTPVCSPAEAAKWERCVQDLKAKNEGVNPFAICTAAVGCHPAKQGQGDYYIKEDDPADKDKDKAFELAVQQLVEEALRAEAP